MVSLIRSIGEHSEEEVEALRTAAQAGESPAEPSAQDLMEALREAYGVDPALSAAEARARSNAMATRFITAGGGSPKRSTISSSSSSLSASDRMAAMRR